VRRLLAQRQLALAGVAILGATSSLAITSRGHSAARELPAAAGSYTALAGTGGAQPVGTKTACGVVVRATTEGVANPVLPCGMRLYVGYRGENVLVRVIDHGPTSGEREFGLTAALASRLGVTGIKRIRWSYVGSQPDLNLGANR
jgi:rare lipoprotein A (peptidoglycan hydrolase)